MQHKSTYFFLDMLLKTVACLNRFHSHGLQNPSLLNMLVRYQGFSFFIDGFNINSLYLTSNIYNVSIKYLTTESLRICKSSDPFHIQVVHQQLWKVPI